MQKFRSFLALFLACWLLALPALADGETDGATDNTPSVSDGASGDTTASEDSAPLPDSGNSASPEEASAPPENIPPAVEEDTLSSADDTLPIEDGAPSSADDTLSADETAQPAEDPVSIDPPADTAVEMPEDPPVSDPPAEAPADVYDAVPVNAPAAEAPQVFTVTTIPDSVFAALKSDTDNTLVQVVRDIFGTYTPRVQTVTTYYNGEQIATEEQYVPGVAGLDWEWLAGFAVFCLMLYCLFRLLGGTVKYG